MVSDQFHDFFLAVTGAVGALIGLLFVAISLSPSAIPGRAGSQKLGFRAAAAMTAFLNALVVSMVALIPGDSLGTGAVIMAVVGILSTSALVVSGLREGMAKERPTALLRWAALLGGLLVIYCVQLVSALRMHGTSADFGHVKTQAVLVVILCVMGISRAWELVGARSPRLLDALNHEEAATASGTASDKPS
ncbi:hypothetical protein ACEZCY_21245 [Streptacidiphilus sp. N1-12]|uniref:Uncharacterized protein n=2 Tax=Streptacidiphilus alkalitolerans TaxID=3342712 RepID=A0ABV6WI81_9ACTN